MQKCISQILLLVPVEAKIKERKGLETCISHVISLVEHEIVRGRRVARALMSSMSPMQNAIKRNGILLRKLFTAVIQISTVSLARLIENALIRIETTVVSSGITVCEPFIKVSRPRSVQVCTWSVCVPVL